MVVPHSLAVEAGKRSVLKVENDLKAWISRTSPSCSVDYAKTLLESALRIYVFKGACCSRQEVQLYTKRGKKIR